MSDGGGCPLWNLITAFYSVHNVGSVPILLYFNRMTKKNAIFFFLNFPNDSTLNLIPSENTLLKAHPFPFVIRKPAIWLTLHFPNWEKKNCMRFVLFFFPHFLVDDCCRGGRNVSIDHTGLKTLALAAECIPSYFKWLSQVVVATKKLPLWRIKTANRMHTTVKVYDITTVARHHHMLW